MQVGRAVALIPRCLSEPGCRNEKVRRLEMCLEHVPVNRLLKKSMIADAHNGPGDHCARRRMRYAASEKLEIIRIVEQSHLPVKRALDQLGIPRRTFYRWYGGRDGLGVMTTMDHVAMYLLISKVEARHRILSSLCSIVVPIPPPHAAQQSPSRRGKLSPSVVWPALRSGLRPSLRSGQTTDPTGHHSRRSTGHR
ncbi:hypothetical protein SAMN02927924_03343 [Sphingobium faniae]|nr:hypothetical protein SAMN02927924_03343 [Sphingobium faniae]